jgi:HlyD family secretion protein
MAIGSRMPQRPVLRPVPHPVSPDQLGELLVVSDARGWLALAGIGVLLGSVAIWSVIGSIPHNVQGTGILVEGGGVFEVVPTAPGRVVEVLVQVGDAVREEQVVARVAQPQLAERLQQARAARDAARAQQADLAVFNDTGAGLQQEHLRQQRRTAKQAIRSAQKAVAWERRKIRAQKRLVAEGLILRQTLLDSIQRQNTAEERLRQAHSQLAELQVSALEQQNRRRTDGFAAGVKVSEAERLVDELARELAAKTDVVARQSGRILELLTEPGRMVSAGDPLMRLGHRDRHARGLGAIVYVPSAEGKRIRNGMSVLVAPTTVKQEEFGRILGQVTSVSELPATTRAMQRALKNEQLVASLAGQDAPFEVHIQLVSDASTASGLRWTSSKGPPLSIESGTMATAHITVNRRRPVQLVLPLLREVSGI